MLAFKEYENRSSLPYNFKNSYLWCYLQFNIKLYLIGKGKEYPFEKKNISVVGNP